MTVIDISDDLDTGFRDKPQRKPGDFARNHMGAPWVTHPTDTTKDGQPKRVLYGRPSSFGTALDNPYSLVRWKERQLLIGAGIVIDREGFPEFTGDRDALDALAARCHQAAGSHLAADQGTHIHLLLERFDDNQLTNWAELWQDGERLDIPAPLQERIVIQWDDFRAELGVTAIGIEQTVVHDRWRLAGTLDRHDRADKDILTGFGIIAAGDTFIGDIKTGGLTLGNDGQPNYWVKYPVQLAAYADGVPYDVETDERGDWWQQPRLDIALIYHYDLARALDGEAVDWQAIPVSLQAGREGGDLCRAAADFAKRRDLFLMPAPNNHNGEPCSDITTNEKTPAAQSSTTSPSPRTSTPSTGASTEPAHATTSTSSPKTNGPDSPVGESTGPSLQSTCDTFTITATGTHIHGERPVTITYTRIQLVDRVRQLITAGYEMDVRRAWPEGVPPLSRDGHTVEQLTALFYMVRRVETEVSFPFQPEPAPEPHVSPMYGIPEPEGSSPLELDDGPFLDQTDIDALKTRIDALPADRQQAVAAIAAEAHAAGRSISVKAKPCVRRWEIARALMRWAETSGELDDIWNKAAWLAIDEDTFDPDITLGGLLSLFTIEQARALHDAFDTAATP